MKNQKTMAKLANLVLLAMVSFSIERCGSNSSSQDTEATNRAPLASFDTLSHADVVFDFEAFSTGDFPQGWEADVTGKGAPGQWQIMSDVQDERPTSAGSASGGKVLAQTSRESSGYHFDVAVACETSYRDLILTLRFKAVKGEEDQGGGAVWRYQDALNYYVARANPLESNFRVYKVVDGRRLQLKSYSLPVISEQWHTIRIEHLGSKIKCYYDGQFYMEVEDQTFMNGGKVGVWTKADAFTMFDDLKIKAIK